MSLRHRRILRTLKSTCFQSQTKYNCHPNQLRVYKNNFQKINLGCQYSTKIKVNCLQDHRITEHAWGKYPCSNANCKFESYSETCFKQHENSHLQRDQKGKDLTETCDRKNCGIKFARYCHLVEHLKSHDNIVIR